MNDIETARRRLLLKSLGAAALLPIASTLGACSGDNTDPQPAAPSPEPDQPAATSEPQVSEPQAMEAEPAADTAAGDSAELTPLNENDAQAQSLAYVENASSVDASVQTRYESGQACNNCVLFMPQGDGARGACSIFPGKSVNRDGWCSVYAAKS